MKNELEVVNIRLVREPSLYSDRPINNPQDAAELMSKELAQYDRKVLCILNLKTNGQVINMNIASVGTINSALVSPREIFKSSILSNASSILVLHNHPSGSLKPSKQDYRITEQLWRCGGLMDIELLDHIIIGGSTGGMHSLREEGYFEELQRKTFVKTDWER